MIASETYADRQSGVSIATAQAFSDSLGLPLSYGASGLPSGPRHRRGDGRDHRHDRPRRLGERPPRAPARARRSPAPTPSSRRPRTGRAAARPSPSPSRRRTRRRSSARGPPTRPTATATRSARSPPRPPSPTPTGDPLTYTASGLPAGLSISAAGGDLRHRRRQRRPRHGTGSRSPPPTTRARRRAKPSAGSSGTCRRRPTARSRTGATPTRPAPSPSPRPAGSPSPNGLALSYSAAGLPAGLAIDPGTGVNHRPARPRRLGVRPRRRPGPAPRWRAPTRSPSPPATVRAVPPRRPSRSWPPTRRRRWGRASADQHAFDGKHGLARRVGGLRRPPTPATSSPTPRAACRRASPSTRRPASSPGRSTWGASRHGPYAVTVTANRRQGRGDERSLHLERGRPWRRWRRPPLADRSVPDGASLAHRDGRRLHPIPTSCR